MGVHLSFLILVVILHFILAFNVLLRTQSDAIEILFFVVSHCNDLLTIRTTKPGPRHGNGITEGLVVRTGRKKYD